MELADVEVLKPPTAAIRIGPPIEAAMKELVDNCRPVRQKTVRSETTKDKAGALAPTSSVLHSTSSFQSNIPQRLNC